MTSIVVADSRTVSAPLRARTIVSVFLVLVEATAGRSRFRDHAGWWHDTLSLWHCDEVSDLDGSVTLVLAQLRHEGFTYSQLRTWSETVFCSYRPERALCREDIRQWKETIVSTSGTFRQQRDPVAARVLASANLSMMREVLTRYDEGVHQHGEQFWDTVAGAALYAELESLAREVQVLAQILGRTGSRLHGVSTHRERSLHRVQRRVCSLLGTGHLLPVEALLARVLAGQQMVSLFDLVSPNPLLDQLIASPWTDAHTAQAVRVLSWCALGTVSVDMDVLELVVVLSEEGALDLPLSMVAAMVSHQVAVSELSRDDEYFVQFGARVISELSSLRSLGLLGEPVLVNEVPLLTGHR